MTSKQNYITSRIAQQHDVKEFDIKHVTLNMLMTAYTASRIVLTSGMAITPSTGPSAKADALTEATLHLMTDRATIVYDNDSDETYYVTAKGDALVAVYYPVGPWQEIYGVISTDSAVLDDMGIFTTTFMDQKLVDKIFQFPELVKKVKGAKPKVEEPAEECPAWAWKRPVAKPDDEDGDVAVAPAEVQVPGQAFKAPTQEPEVNRKLDSQMQQAFKDAVDTNGQSGGTRHQPRHESRQERRGQN